MFLFFALIFILSSGLCLVSCGDGGSSARTKKSRDKDEDEGADEFDTRWVLSTPGSRYEQDLYDAPLPDSFLLWARGKSYIYWTLPSMDVSFYTAVLEIDNDKVKEVKDIDAAMSDPYVLDPAWIRMNINDYEYLESTGKVPYGYFMAGDDGVPEAVE